MASAFPGAIDRTVENLRELPGVGEVRIKQFVHAAVLCAYDQAITRQGEQTYEEAKRPCETMDLAAGWLDLLGHWPDLEQIYVAQLAVPERLGHELAAATRPGERLIARAVHEIAALLHTDTKRRAAIIAGRARCLCHWRRSIRSWPAFSPASPHVLAPPQVACASNPPLMCCVPGCVSL